MVSLWVSNILACLGCTEWRGIVLDHIYIGHSKCNASYFHPWKWQQQIQLLCQSGTATMLGRANSHPQNTFSTQSPPLAIRFHQSACHVHKRALVEMTHCFIAVMTALLLEKCCSCSPYFIGLNTFQSEGNKFILRGGFGRTVQPRLATYFTVFKLTWDLALLPSSLA